MTELLLGYGFPLIKWRAAINIGAPLILGTYASCLKLTFNIRLAFLYYVMIQK